MRVGYAHAFISDWYSDQFWICKLPNCNPSVHGVKRGVLK